MTGARCRLACALGLLLAGAAVGSAQDRAATDSKAAAPELARIKQELDRLTTEMVRIRGELAECAARSGGGEPKDEHIRALESRLAAIEDQLRQLAEASRETGNALDALSREDQKRISLTVYGSLDASHFRGEPTLLTGKLVELVLSGRPHKRLSFITQIEFEEAADVGGRLGGSIKVEQSYAALSLAPLLSVRAGIYLVPFGNVNIDHFPPKRDVVSQPLVAEVVAPPADWTDNGIGLSGRRLLGQAWLLTYEAYLGAGLGSGISALGLGDAQQGYGVDNNSNKAAVGRVAFNRMSRLELGLSGYRGKYDDEGRRALSGWAVDGLSLLGPLTLTGEYASFTADRVPGPDARFRGYYLRATYSFGRKLLAKTGLGRDFDEPRLALVLQHDRALLDGPLHGEWVRNRETRSSVGVNFRPSSQWVIKLGYEWNATTNRPLIRGDQDGWVGSIGFIF